VQTITSIQNPKVSFWRGLKTRAARQEAGLYIVEGLKMVDEALQMDLARALLIDMDKLNEYQGLTASASCEAYAVSPHILASVCDTKTPQGVAALVSLQDTEDLYGLGQLIVALDGVQDPGNVGTILRTADAAGFSGMLLSEECADLYSPKCLRATMGSIFRLKALVAPSLPEALAKLKKTGYSLLSGELSGTPFYERTGVGSRLCLVIGSEGSGISKAVSGICTHRLTLPMRGGAESLNAAVAAGIMMYDLINRS
jgi:TrmH family RNA methyltransferase